MRIKGDFDVLEFTKTRHKKALVARSASYLIAALSILPTQANAQVQDLATGAIIPNASQCSAPHGAGLGVVPVRQFVGPSNHWAHSLWMPDGWPTIVYGPAYFQLPTVMQRFTSAHECGHLRNQSPDEFAANCLALQVGGFSFDEVQFIRSFHQNLGPLPANYGGSGSSFWLLTAARCPDLAH